MTRRGVFLVWLLVLFAAHRALGSDFRVLPGRQIGVAVLGMTRQQMHKALGRPDETVRLDGGVVREDWLSKAAAPKSYVEDGLYFKHDFLTAYFRDGRAIQIEVSSPLFKTADGLCTASGAKKFQERYPGYTRIYPHNFRNPDPGGYPAVKHFLAYEDAVAKGIAWRYGAWGDLAPDPDPSRLETVIVHRRGEPVFIDPDGGVRLVWKVSPHISLDNHPGNSRPGCPTFWQRFLQTASTSASAGC